MDITGQFLLAYGQTESPKGRILDYGCGSGAVVSAGLKSGLDIYGCEVFYGGGCGDRERVAGLLGERIFEFPAGGDLPFPDSYFDLIFNNQVFEHVHDLDTVLSEIRRVLKPSGVLLSLFPSIDVLREGHCGIPLAHRFSRDSKPGFAYIWILRSLGMGYHHNNKSASRWTRDFMDWLDEYCCYRSKGDISSTFVRAGFVTRNDEIPYLLYRLDHSTLRPTKHVIRYFPRLSSWLFRKLGFMVLLSTINQRLTPEINSRVSLGSMTSPPLAGHDHANMTFANLVVSVSTDSIPDHTGNLIGFKLGATRQFNEVSS